MSACVEESAQMSAIVCVCVCVYGWVGGWGGVSAWEWPEM